MASAPNPGDRRPLGSTGHDPANGEPLIRQPPDRQHLNERLSPVENLGRQQRRTSIPGLSPLLIGLRPR